MTDHLAVDREVLESGQVHRYRLRLGKRRLRYVDVLDRWQEDPEFVRFFSGVLADSEFLAFRWETPPLTLGTVEVPFEFVLVDTPGFVRRPPDRSAFREAFHGAADPGGIVEIDNLGGDAGLVIPLPQADPEAYGHLAIFLREGPREQVDALWRHVAKSVWGRLGTRPLWLSTAGGGVAWLHVRLDSRPKYYHYEPYRRATGDRSR